jgi:WD40 repeat protein
MADVGTPTDDILRSSGDDGDHSLGAEEIIKSLDEDVIDMAKNDVVKHIFGEAALHFVGQTVEAAVGMIPFGKEIMKLGVGIFKRCSAVGELATQVKSAQELVKSLVKDVAECATSIKTEEDSLPLVECLKELYVLTMQISKLGKVAKTVTVNTFLEKLKEAEANLMTEITKAGFKWAAQLKLQIDALRRDNENTKKRQDASEKKLLEHDEKFRELTRTVEHLKAEADSGVASVEELLDVITHINWREEAKKLQPDSREWLMGPIQNWCNDEKGKKRLYCLVADAGMGKTVISGHLVLQTKNIIAHHFIRHEKSTLSNGISMMKSIAWQLCNRGHDSHLEDVQEDVRMRIQEKDDFKEYRDFINLPKTLRRIEEAGGSAEKLFRILFVEGLAKIKKGFKKRRVILIDAIDECLKKKDSVLQVLKEHFSDTSNLPDWLCFFVTTRPMKEENGIEQIFDGAFDFANEIIVVEPSTNDSGNRDDLELIIAAGLEGIGDPEAVPILIEKSEYRFIYVKFILESIRESSELYGRPLTVDEINDLPEGINKYYADQLERINEHLNKNEKALTKSIIQLVRLARQPMTPDMCQKVLEISPTEMKKGQEILKTFFPIQDGFLGVYHKSFLDFLNAEFLDEDETISNEYYCDEIQEQQQEEKLFFKPIYDAVKTAKDADILSKPLDSLDDFTKYFLKNGIDHLVEAGKVQDAMDLIFDVYWLMLRRNDVSGLVDDFHCLFDDKGEKEEDADPDLDLLFEAVILGSTFITKVPTQMPCQLVGRLIGYEGYEELPKIRKLLKDLKDFDNFEWWCPMLCSMTQAGDPCKQIMAHQGSVYSSDIYDSQYLATACGNNRVSIDDLYEVSHASNVELKHSSGVKCVAWSHGVIGSGSVSREVLATGTNDGSVYFWENWRKKKERKERVHKSAVLHLAWSPDDTMLATCGQDGNICVFKSKKLEFQLKGTEENGGFNTASFVGWNSDGGKLACSYTSSQCILVWNMSTRQVEARIDTSGAVDGNGCPSFLWEQTQFLYVCVGFKIEKWNVGHTTPKLENFKVFQSEKNVDIELTSISGYFSKSRRFQYEDEKSFLVVGGREGDVIVVDLSEDKELEIKFRLVGHNQTINSVSISVSGWAEDDVSIVTGCGDNTARYWVLGSTNESIPVPKLDRSHGATIDNVSFCETVSGNYLKVSSYMGKARETLLSLDGKIEKSGQNFFSPNLRRFIEGDVGSIKVEPVLESPTKRASLFGGDSSKPAVEKDNRLGLHIMSWVDKHNEHNIATLRVTNPSTDKTKKKTYRFCWGADSHRVAVIVNSKFVEIFDSNAYPYPITLYGRSQWDLNNGNKQIDGIDFCSLCPDCKRIVYGNMSSKKIYVLDFETNVTKTLKNWSASLNDKNKNDKSKWICYWDKDGFLYVLCVMLKSLQSHVTIFDSNCEEFLSVVHRPVFGSTDGDSWGLKTDAPDKWAKMLSFIGFHSNLVPQLPASPFTYKFDTTGSYISTFDGDLLFLYKKMKCGFSGFLSKKKGELYTKARLFKCVHGILTYPSSGAFTDMKSINLGTFVLKEQSESTPTEICVDNGKYKLELKADSAQKAGEWREHLQGYCLKAFHTHEDEKHGYMASWKKHFYQKFVGIPTKKHYYVVKDHKLIKYDSHEDLSEKVKTIDLLHCVLDLSYNPEKEKMDPNVFKLIYLDGKGTKTHIFFQPKDKADSDEWKDVLVDACNHV